MFTSPHFPNIRLPPVTAPIYGFGFEDSTSGVRASQTFHAECTAPEALDWEDQKPEFFFRGTAFVTIVEGGKGNCNLRLRAQSETGTQFQQCVIVRVVS